MASSRNTAASPAQAFDVMPMIGQEFHPGHEPDDTSMAANKIADCRNDLHSLTSLYNPLTHQRTALSSSASLLSDNSIFVSSTGSFMKSIGVLDRSITLFSATLIPFGDTSTFHRRTGWHAWIHPDHFRDLFRVQAHVASRRIREIFFNKGLEYHGIKIAIRRVIIIFRASCGMNLSL